MSQRNTILDDFTTLLGTITVANGYENDVENVWRAFYPWDKVYKYPSLMVLGGDEEFDGILDGTYKSELAIIIRGYTRDVQNPEQALCSAISDVLIALESDANTYKDKMFITGVNTDEGFFQLEQEGVGLFEINLTVLYAFTRGSS